MPVTTPPGTPPRTPPGTSPRSPPGLPTRRLLRSTHGPHLTRGSTSLVRDGFPNFPRPLTDDEDHNLNRLFMYNEPNESLIHNNNNVGVEITPPTGADTKGGLRRCKGTKRKGTKRKQNGGLEAAAGAEVPAVRDHVEENEDTPAKAKAYNNLKTHIRRRYAMIPAQPPIEPPSIANNIAATAIEKEHLPHFHLGGNMFGRKGTKRKSTKRKSTKRH